MRKDCRVHRGMVMLGPLVFRLPILFRASCSWLERNATNSSTDFTWSSNVCGRSSSLAFLSSRDTFAYWVVLLCRRISPFADVNILTALLPVSYTKTVFRCMRKAVGLFHRIWTPSRWPAVSPHSFVRVSVPPSISSSFKLNSACSLLEDKNTVSPSVTAIPLRPGIFEIVLSFNRPLTWKRSMHEPFPSPTNRYCLSHVKANEDNKLDRPKQNNLLNCPTQLVSSSSPRSRKVSYFVLRKQMLRDLKQILQYKWA